MNSFGHKYPDLYRLTKDISRWADIHMVRGHTIQNPVSRSKIFEVVLNISDANKHVFISTATKERIIPHGRYIFVNRVDIPRKVFAMRECSVDIGHTSLTRRQNSALPVRFAGELVYNKGVLVLWGNNSGHYRPDKRFYQFNLLPWVRRILPKDKFKPFS